MKIRLPIRKRKIRSVNYHSTYSKKKFKISSVSLGFITVIILSLVSLFYLAQANQITTKGYILQKLEIEKSKILSENETLKVEAARLESLNKISEKAEDLSMTPTQELNYFKAFNDTLASNN